MRRRHRLPLFALFGAGLTMLVAARWAEGGAVRVPGGAAFGPRTGIFMRAAGAAGTAPTDEGGRRRGLRFAAPTQPSTPLPMDRTRYRVPLAFGCQARISTSPPAATVAKVVVASLSVSVTRLDPPPGQVTTTRQPAAWTGPSPRGWDARAWENGCQPGPRGTDIVPPLVAA